jgi:hypothetical protein
MEIWNYLVNCFKSENYKCHSPCRAAAPEASLYLENIDATPLSPLSRGETLILQKEEKFQLFIER